MAFKTEIITISAYIEIENKELQKKIIKRVEPKIFRASRPILQPTIYD